MAIFQMETNTTPCSLYLAVGCSDDSDSGFDMVTMSLHYWCDWFDEKLAELRETWNRHFIEGHEAYVDPDLMMRDLSDRDVLYFNTLRPC